MKKTLLVLLAFASAGCAAAAKQTYRTETQPAADWVVEGVQSGFGRLRISINGQQVMEGSISVWSGEGKLSGFYEGQALAATCEKGSGYVRTRCVLTLNGNKMTTLHFRAL